MRNALVICDMINDFAEKTGALYSPQIEGIIGKCRIHLEDARRFADPIAWLVDQHRPKDAEFKEFPEHGIGPFGRQIVQELKPFFPEKYVERIVPKRRFSGFYGTDLDITLREWNVTGITLVGNCTDICVLYTAADARALGYEVSIPTDAVATFRQQQYHMMALDMMKINLGCTLITERKELTPEENLAARL